MEPSLESLRSGGGGGGATGLLPCGQTTANAEKDYYMGMTEEAGVELGLELSLGSINGKVVGKGKSTCAWGEYGRILTAKDFPNGFSSGIKRERAAADGRSASAALSRVVGWPPIRSYRMNTLFNQSKSSNIEEENKGVGGNEKNEYSKKKINHGVHDKTDAVVTKENGHIGFVKVNMDGSPIGRKLDLNAHMCYKSLATSLEEMFFNSSHIIRGGNEQSIKSPKLLDGSSEFVLTYEDKEGDWMLVGDVPWRMFVNTVKRLRIMRTSEANGLAPKSQERKENQKGKPI